MQRQSNMGIFKIATQQQRDAKIIRVTRTLSQYISNF
jgi:hypothetical protein